MEADNSFYAVPRYRVCLVREDAVGDANPNQLPPNVTTPREVADIFSKFLQDTDREHVVVLLLDSKNHPIGINTVSIGSLNTSVIHPREVFKAAILANAASVILGHNHPSGDPTPSSEDIGVTNNLNQASGILGIPLRDHVIVGAGGRYFSFKNEGLL